MDFETRGRVRLVGTLLVLVLLVPGCTMSVGNPISRAKSEAVDLLERYRKQNDTERTLATEDEEAEGEIPAPSLETLLAQGDRHRSSGQLAGALYSYLQAHGSNRERTEPRERIAYLHLRRDPSLAESIFETILAEAPYEARYHTGLALSLIAQDRLEEARDALTEAIHLDAAAATPRALIGVIHDRLGDHEAAQVQYERAHQLRPTDWVILNNLGVSLLLSRAPEEAALRLREAVHLKPRDPALRNNLGLALGLSGRYEEAFFAFKRLGGEARAHNNLGWVHYLTGDYALAQEHFEQALSVGGDELLTVVKNITLARRAQEENLPAPLEWADALPLQAADPEPAPAS